MVSKPSIEQIPLGHDVCVDEPAWSSRPVRQQHVPALPLAESLSYRAAKRIADILIAGFAIVVFSPILVYTAFRVWFEDRGPVLYRQPRIGRFGVPFWFYKFRSMRVDADALRSDLLELSDAKGAAFKMREDPRITKFGRFIRKYSIDELPQLFSILAGHMSVVGPRPHLASEVETYTTEEHVRLFVKPGLLCLREISGRSRLSFNEWIRLDLQYVDTRSLWLDTKIFILAIPAVIKGDGAY